ncbi:hypothetical protein [Miltoncostaea marina]|uniref:hypothetical protein n=1 Tax=Miltoncostaea marina TaxID=2843215 RepID=UPI001C3DA95A|nr:hypothetical protein [Miltoncostaea marina]
MDQLLDDGRLREQAGAPHPELHSGIARDWIAGVPAAVERIRAARGEDLAAALHELRSGAVAVGLRRLPAELAAVEQAVERGDPAAEAGLPAALELAGRSAAALDAWWDAAGTPP